MEGGWYSEEYRSALTIEKTQLPAAFKGDRSICTHIYFLLEQGNYSAFHRIASDELWHFYYGDSLIVYELDQTGKIIEHFYFNERFLQDRICF